MDERIVEFRLMTEEMKVKEESLNEREKKFMEERKKLEEEMAVFKKQKQNFLPLIELRRCDVAKPSIVPSTSKAGPFHLIELRREVAKPSKLKAGQSNDKITCSCGELFV